MLACGHKVHDALTCRQDSTRGERMIVTVRSARLGRIEEPTLLFLLPTGFDTRKMAD